MFFPFVILLLLCAPVSVFVFAQTPTGQPSSLPTCQPSSQPTRQPSGQPTRLPTIQPSSQPTRQPTSQPTGQPTRLPSGQPSRQPSSQPSTQPSRQPSSQPSMQPRSSPSTQPSRQPTSQPSKCPSSQPTMQPSRQPSAQPSMQPSRQPTMQPSIQPTRRPSTQPSSKPSSQPSRQPFSRPTSQPSNQPSSQPSKSPSRQPTAQPSRQPSSKPTMQPSRQPTSQPSRLPTSQPSSQPSRQPSSQPTMQPSRKPSSQPSRQPSSQPSMQPSRIPTGQPSGQPVQKPSAQPSRLPSAQPSTQPSRQPTSQPSAQPFLRPTGRPTGQPSGQPSLHPLTRPTSAPTEQPSSQPSMQPRSLPSTQPSRQPSSQPSMQPSRIPTGQPSKQPVSRPSSQPSRLPTSQPSRQPSSQPTAHPSRLPSSQPSMQPSTHPTSQPSKQPVSRPTSQPSRLPSSQPSKQPSSQPTAQPSRSPTSQPSMQPSTLPTSQPSKQPIARPSSQPSRAPSSQPSRQPFSQPTAQPSRQPTSQPSTCPSSQPTGQPSRQPISNPSSQPSLQPTSRPSSLPSSQPSSQPSKQPTSKPSAQPSFNPTSQPSRQPTSQPSNEPSTQPTGRPTTPSSQPTSHPSMQPSNQPSSQPSRQPTSQPTKQPSSQPNSRPSSLPSSQPTGAPTSSPTAACRPGYWWTGELPLIKGGICYPCGVGTYQPEYQQLHCLECAPGTSSIEASPLCTPCAFNTYSIGHTNRTCDICPPRRITFQLGSTSKADCIDPTANFIVGTLALSFTILLASMYLGAGRFQRVAFLRRERVVGQLSKMCFEFSQTLRDTTLEDKRKDHARDLANKAHEAFEKSFWFTFSTLKTILFICISIVLVLVATTCVFIALLTGIFFRSLIIWHIHINAIADFKDLAHQAIAAVAEYVNIAYIKELFYPLIVIFDVLASFRLDLNAVGVTCAGSTAPVQLVVNMFILGVVIIVIESQWQLFRLMSLNVFSFEFFTSATLYSFRSEFVSDDSKGCVKYLYMAGNYIKYFFLLVGCIAVQVISITDPFQSGLQYMMAYVTIAPFQANHGAHEITQGCDHFPSLPGFDSALGNASTAIAYLLVIPLIYEISKILVPGLPRWSETGSDKYDVVQRKERKDSHLSSKQMKQLNSIREEAESLAQKRGFFEYTIEQEDMIADITSRSSRNNCVHPIINASKGLSFFSPDLMLGFLAASWIRFLGSIVDSNEAKRKNKCDEEAQKLEKLFYKWNKGEKDYLEMDEFREGLLNDLDFKFDKEVEGWKEAEQVKAIFDYCDRDFNERLGKDEFFRYFDPNTAKAEDSMIHRIETLEEDSDVLATAKNAAEKTEKTAKLILRIRYRMGNYSCCSSCASCCSCCKCCELITCFKKKNEHSETQTSAADTTFSRSSPPPDASPKDESHHLREAPSNNASNNDSESSHIDSDEVAPAGGVRGAGSKAAGKKEAKGGGGAVAEGGGGPVAAEGERPKELTPLDPSSTAQKAAAGTPFSSFCNFSATSKKKVANEFSGDVSDVFGYAFKQRTRKEDLKWETKTLNQLPYYSRLLWLEYRELLNLLTGTAIDELPHHTIGGRRRKKQAAGGDGVDQEEKEACRTIARCCFSPFLWLFVSLGFGHLATSVGRFTFSIVVWKYITFFAVGLGIWWDELFDDFDIENMLRSHCTVEIGNMNLDPDAVDVSRYKKDFSDSLSAIIGSRAIIFMMYPPLVFFTIFASSLSNAPICVYPLDFERYQFFPEWNRCLFVRFKPYREGVKADWCSYFFSQFSWCKRSGKVVNEQEAEAAKEPERFHYYLQNKLVLDCFQQAFVRLVAERQSSSSLLWKSALRGIDIFFNESRGIRWLLNLYLYILTVGVLYYPNLLVSTVWVLVPYAFFASLSSVVFVGNLMAIDDDHLKVFSPWYWWSHIKGCCSCCQSKKEDEANNSYHNKSNKSLRLPQSAKDKAAAGGNEEDFPPFSDSPSSNGDEDDNWTSR